MANIGIQRKRSRSIENEFGEEFFPLSKRINNLELTFSQIIINKNDHQHKDLHQPLSSEQLISHQIVHHDHHQAHHRLHAHCSSYNPELSIDQNPHYYYKNNVLYDLYMERMKRNESSKNGQ